MSINPEIWRKASPSNRRRLRAALRLLPAALGGLVFAFFCAGVPWGQALAHLRERSDERAALAPILAEAKRADLTFPQVVASYPAHLNKAVYWNVTVPASTSAYAEGRPAWAVVWTNPYRVPETLAWQPGSVLARVAGVRDDVVFLDYLGRP